MIFNIIQKSRHKLRINLSKYILIQVLIGLFVYMLKHELNPKDLSFVRYWLQIQMFNTVAWTGNTIGVCQLRGRKRNITLFLKQFLIPEGSWAIDPHFHNPYLETRINKTCCFNFLKNPPILYSLVVKWVQTYSARKIVLKRGA